MYPSRSSRLQTDPKSELTSRGLNVSRAKATSIAQSEVVLRALERRRPGGPAQAEPPQAGPDATASVRAFSNLELARRDPRARPKSCLKYIPAYATNA